MGTILGPKYISYSYMEPLGNAREATPRMIISGEAQKMPS